MLYAGELGAIRHSTIHRLSKDFSEKTCLSFKYVLSGQENYAFDKEQFSLEKGQALFFKDEKSYQCSIDSHHITSGLCVDLNFGRIPSVLIDPLIEKEMFFFDPDFCTQRITFLAPNLHFALNRITVENAEENQLYFQEFMHNIMMQVLNMEAGYTEKIRLVPSKKLSYQKELFRRLLLAKNYIYDHRYKGASLKDIAQESHLSEFYLHRLFSKVFGYSPSSYLEQLRMIEAKEKLQKGQRVKEVCFAVGYNDESYFCRRFKKFYGKTPKQYQLSKPN